MIQMRSFKKMSVIENMRNGTKSDHAVDIIYLFFYSVCEAIGTAATPGILCQPRVIVRKQMECRLAGETEVLGENLPQRRFCSSQNPTDQTRV
jgi:hypothetical protein